MSDDATSPFIPGPRAMVKGAESGPLAGLTFAVKDLYDVAGHVTSYGHPEWARTHGVAAGTSPIVTTLLEAGATLAGKTKTVELAYGLTGENVWHGTPTNPKAPDRFPGGSSCGSAAAVAAGLVDFAMGSDTGGSVRIPASYCGVFGIRPSWGAITLAGTCALGPSFDTPGWFAADARTLLLVGEQLLPFEPGGPDCLPAGPLLKPEEVWINCDPAVARAMLPALEATQRVMGTAMRMELAPEGLHTLYENFRCMQAEEAWATLGGWVTRTQPQFGPGVGERFEGARTMPAEKAAAGRVFRRRFQHRMRSLLQGGAVLAYPTSPVPAPRLMADQAEQNAVREQTMGATAISGLGGLAEVSIPAAVVNGAPVGFSLVAAAGRDRMLMRLAVKVAEELGL
ncbi:amidase [Rhodovarius crocodyli]|nr:amidase [Rhodovarius crocodyli]